MSSDQKWIRVICRNLLGSESTIMRMQVSRVPEVKGVLMINSLPWTVDYRLDPEDPLERDYECTLVVSKL